MSLFWGSTHTTLYVPNSHSTFALLEVTQGVFQGECLSTAVFCTHLRDAFDTFLAQIKLLFPDRNPTQVVQVLAFVDDVVLIIEPADSPPFGPFGSTLFENSTSSLNNQSARPGFPPKSPHFQKLSKNSELTTSPPQD